MAILLGTVVGFVLAIPPGPIGMAAIRVGVNQGWQHSMRLALGAGAFDVLYCGLAMVAATFIVDSFNVLEKTSPLTPTLIQLVIVLAMIVFGLLQIKVQSTPTEQSTTEFAVGSRFQRFFQWVRTQGPFFVGVGFAIANLANPTFIPALSVMTTTVKTSTWYQESLVNDMLFSMSFGGGNVIWLMLLSRFVISQKHRMTPVFIQRIQQISGMTLIGFGTAFGIRIVVSTKWTELIKLAFSF